MNILLLYPEFPETFWSFKHALAFVNREASNPPLGLITVAAMLPREWKKRLVDMNVQKLSQRDLEWADVVMVSAMDVQRQSAHLLIGRAKAAGKMVIAGGPLFTAEYDAFPEVDHFILNEGEITLPQFLADLAQGSPKRVYTTEEYADIHTSPMPLFELLDLDRYDSFGIQFSRGCPFNCEFCNVTALLGHRPRTKTAAQLIAELDRLYALGWRRNIFMVDDNFIGNKKILKEEILPAIIHWRQGKIGCMFITEASINLSDDAELMDLMSQAGFYSVFVGIETPDEAGLAECNKTQNKGRNLVEAVKRIQRHGMQVMGGFIVGFDSDTPAIFQRQVDFIQESGIVTAMVGLLQAPNGTQLYQRMQKEGRLLSEMSGDNADGSTNIIPRMDPNLLRRGYRYILAKIYSPKLFYQRVRTLLIEFNPREQPVRVVRAEIRALFLSMWKLGVLGRERWEYWSLFFWTIFHFPSKLPFAVTMTIYGYHFSQVSQKVLNIGPEDLRQPNAPRVVSQLA
ncbi:MAG TPA: DUF4070 domain-containing protein, partial [Anaerolineaceae bacterium]|nr:DUF4070 domain-containing protein [Anaerolineaceae bacterium]